MTLYGINLNWLLVPLIIGFSLWLTRSPELRPNRWKFFAGMAVIGALVWICGVTDNPVFLALLLVLVRPIMFLVGFLWAEVIGQTVAEAVSSTVFGGDSAPVNQKKTNYDHAIDYRKGGQPLLAIDCLKSNVKLDPDDFDTLFLLASIYAEDCADLSNANLAIQKIQASKLTRPDFKEYATRQLSEWCARIEKPKGTFVVTPPPAAAPPPKPEFVGLDGARAHRSAGRSGSAIEVLEAHLAHCPNDFEALMLLASVYAEDCTELRKAEKVVERILRNEAIKAPDKEIAQIQLKVWKIKILNIG